MTDNSSQQAARQLLTAWIRDAAAKQPQLPLQTALRAALAHKDARIAELAQQSRDYQKTQCRTSQHPGGNPFPFDRENPLDLSQEPATLALRALTEPNQSVSALLEDAVAAAMTQEPDCRELAEAATTEDRRERLLQQATDERAAARLIISLYRENPHACPPPRSQQSKGPRPKPLDPKKLGKIEQDLRATLHAAVSAAYSIGTASPDKPMTPPADPTQLLHPPIRYDAATLAAAGCGHLKLLHIGPEGDAAVQETLDTFLETRLPDILQQRADSVELTAANQQRRREQECGYEPYAPQDDDLYPSRRLKSLWKLLHPTEPMPELWLAVSRGRTGEAARRRADHSAWETANQRAIEFLKENSGFDDYEIADYRSGPRYNGPRHDASLQDLTRLWRTRNPDLPMPRRWHTLIKGVNIHLVEASRIETAALQAYASCVSEVQDAIERELTAGTITKRIREAEAALIQLENSRRSTEYLFGQSAWDCPAPEQGPPIPDHPHKRPPPQHAMAMTGVETVVPPPKRAAAPPPRPKPQPESMTMRLQF